MQTSISEQLYQCTLCTPQLALTHSFLVGRILTSSKEFRSQTSLQYKIAYSSHLPRKSRELSEESRIE